MEIEISLFFCRKCKQVNGQALVVGGAEAWAQGVGKARTRQSQRFVYI